jgi:hypothetical protein
MTRKGGNPDIKQYGFNSGRDEPLTKQITLKVTESTLEQLKELGDEKADFCRNAIQKALDERNSKSK